MNTLSSTSATTYSLPIERVFFPTSKIESTYTKANTSFATVMAIIILIVASIFTSPANAGSRENRLALGNTVLHLLGAVILTVDSFVDGNDLIIWAISAGDIECTNDACNVQITNTEDCIQNLQLSPNGAGAFHTTGAMECAGSSWLVDANMSVWTPGLDADALSNDHPVSLVSLANFVRRDNSNTETQYERRSVVEVNSGKKKGKRTMSLSGGAITVNKSNLDVITDECIVKMRDMRNVLRVEASCIILPKISAATNTQPAVVVNYEVDHPVTSFLGGEVVRSSSGTIKVMTVDLIPGL